MKSVPAADDPASSPAPEIDVVILTWNDGALLDTAVGSALSSEGVRPHVIVVDNASEPPAIVSSLDVVLLRNDSNKGVARGRNRGAAAGSAPFLCFLDSDAELAPQSLRLLAEAHRDSEVAVSVPIFAGQAPEASAGRAPTLGVKLSRALGRRSTYEPSVTVRTASHWDVDFGIGACQLIRRDVFEAVGGLDESYFYGPEDVDFCLRVRAAGHRVVQVAGTEVRHPPRRAFRRPLSRNGARHGWNVVRHLWRHRARRMSP